MLNLIRYHSQSQSLNMSYCFLGRLPISKNAWEFQDFGKPATVFFSLRLDGQSHQCVIAFRT